MKIDIKIPASGESLTEGEIARWMKSTGEIVEMDDPLLELETEKASLEINAEAGGRLTISVEAGATVKVGQVVGYVDTEFAADEAPAAASPAPAEATAPAAASPAPAEAAEAKTSAPSSEAKRPAANKPTLHDFDLPSPAARKLMAEHDLSADEIEGSGKGGRITKADVLNFLEERKKQEAILNSRQKFIDFYGSDAPVVSPDETITLFRRPAREEIPRDSLPSEVTPSSADPIPTAQERGAVAEGGAGPCRNRREEKMTRLRKTIAKRLVSAQQTAALLTTFNEVDMSAIIGIRRTYKEAFKESHNVGLGFMSFFTTAACHALLESPIINAQMSDETIVFHDYCDIGVAVASPRGLVVPVVRNAESMSFHELEQEIVDLATKAKDGRLSLEELSGGTFTITNGGVFGSMLSTPIVNQPQSAILGMHNIVERPVALNGEVVIRPIMYVALTYDHRLIDGSDAVRFLVRIKQLCEDPVKLLLKL